MTHQAVKPWAPALPGTAAAIAGAVGFAAAQPLYDILGRNSAFFVAHQADGRDLVAFCLVLSLGLPLLLTLLVAACRAFGERPARVARTAVLSSCGALFGLGAARAAELGGAVAAVGALTVAGAVALASRSPRWSRGLAALGIGAVLFPALFLMKPEVRALWDDDGAEVDAATAGSTTEPVVPVVPVAPVVPVVLVIFDELPTASLMTPDHQIDAGRFPNLARLAATASWYRRATTVSQATIYSVPAILTGNYPEPRVRKAPAIRDYRPNLFTHADGTMPINAWETMTRLCPRRICQPPEGWRIPRDQRLAAMLSDSAAVLLGLVAPAGWVPGLPTFEDQWRDFWGGTDPWTAGAAPRTVLERSSRPNDLFAWFLNTLEQRGSEPALHYAHVLLPHRPWIWLPDGRRFASYLPYPHGLVNQRWRGSEWETTQAHQRHLLTVGFIDTLVGRLVQTMQRTRIFDRSLLIITSDHGSTFTTGGFRRNLGQEPLDEIVGVPLFVKYPGQTTGEIDDRNAETIDIVPTILATLGVELRERLDGQDLRDPTGAKSADKRTFRSGNKKASAGGVLEYSAEEPAAGRQEALDAIARRFGSGSWAPLYAAGPRPDLLGRRPGDLPPAPGAGGTRVEIVDLDRLDNVDLDTDPLPIHLHGFVVAPETATESPLRLALAVNGRIHATTETYESDAGPAFTALLPPDAFRRGANRLEVLVVEGQEPATVLRALPAIHRARGSE